MRLPPLVAAARRRSPPRIALCAIRGGRFILAAAVSEVFRPGAHSRFVAPARGVSLTFILALLAACEGSNVRPGAAEPSAPAVAARPAPAPLPQPPTPGPRRLLWRQGEEAGWALTLDRPAIGRLSDAERAAVGYLSTTVGTDCTWTSAPSPDGGAGKMRCELTDALGLGEQCGAKHRAFILGWLGDDAPSRCAQIPTTAFSQSAFDELRLERDGDRVVVDYAVVHTAGPTGPTHSWSETIRFAPRGAQGLRIESRRVTKGKPPP